MKEEKYKKLLKVVASLIESESNLIANMANICAVIKEEFNHHWVGFYLVDQSANELILGPFQGPLACTRIGYDKGVCGKAWSSHATLIVEDVHKFPGHIACSALSNSEIVVPVIKDENVIAVLDIDSVNFSEFDFIDQANLENLVKLLTQRH